MNDTTRRALAEINRRFYTRHAESFSATRGGPWTGWNRLLEHVVEPARGGLRVLDTGCGNGRFGAFLAGHRSDRIAYTGVDGSAELLAAARRRLADSKTGGRMSLRLAQLDLTGGDLERCLGPTSFHLIVLFGILHHIPGRAGRAELLERLAARLDAGGVLVASLWRFDRLRRLAAKILAWEDYNRAAIEPIELQELESGDYLLGWAGDRDTPRYCHLVDEGEVSSVLAAAGLICRVRFASDGAGGDLNRYLVFGTAAGS